MIPTWRYLLLDRQPFSLDAQSLFVALDQPNLMGFITATTITDLYYVLRKEKGKDVSISLLKDLLEVVDIVGVDREIVTNALQLNWTDFEDAIQTIAAEHQNVDFIITRNTTDFRASTITALSPADFLKKRST